MSHFNPVVQMRIASKLPANGTAASPITLDDDAPSEIAHSNIDPPTQTVQKESVNVAPPQPVPTSLSAPATGTGEPAKDAQQSQSVASLPSATAPSNEAPASVSQAVGPTVPPSQAGVSIPRYQIPQALHNGGSHGQIRAPLVVSTMRSNVTPPSQLPNQRTAASTSSAPLTAPLPAATAAPKAKPAKKSPRKSKVAPEDDIAQLAIQALIEDGISDTETPRKRKKRRIDVTADSAPVPAAAVNPVKQPLSAPVVRAPIDPPQPVASTSKLPDSPPIATLQSSAETTVPLFLNSPESPGGRSHFSNPPDDTPFQTDQGSVQSHAGLEAQSALPESPPSQPFYIFVPSLPPGYRLSTKREMRALEKAG
ncbi:hypothetical protein SISSUDRAFT_799117 [Sistotremastrum suecicum HHB10207 ss-3]|uniref:Uncharacterized protein n=1 Tax=Sistotremastrum suecicum HHB10207 ss-3 TaxID=1314776 RepID=A0A166HQE4_9AGAM|nr:hypothetical protein SISSUDRAFT_799117 [Sistotremastrum suecicum HHB10207 ss-3]